MLEEAIYNYIPLCRTIYLLRHKAPGLYVVKDRSDCANAGCILWLHNRIFATWILNNLIRVHRRS